MGVLLSRADYESALGLVGDAGTALVYDEAVSTLLLGLPKLVASELTTLSYCDLANGRRTVVANPARALAPAQIESFDRYFNEHPLVRYHGAQRGGTTRRISDCVPGDVFRRTPLYNEYYRAVRLDHAMAMPIVSVEGLLVSFVLNRRGRDFSDRDRALLEVVRGPVGRVLRARRAIAAHPALAALSVREREILEWVARGKTNADIGAILAISARTVQKHLENVFAKLGVETRTAAVARLKG